MEEKTYLKVLRRQFLQNHDFGSKIALFDLCKDFVDFLGVYFVYITFDKNKKSFSLFKQYMCSTKADVKLNQDQESYFVNKTISDMKSYYAAEGLL